MSYYVRKESVIDGEIIQRGPFATENEARMELANEVEETLGEMFESSNRECLTGGMRDILAEVDEAVRMGSKEILDEAGNVVYAFSVERE